MNRIMSRYFVAALVGGLAGFLVLVVVSSIGGANWLFERMGDFPLKHWDEAMRFTGDDFFGSIGRAIAGGAIWIVPSAILAIMCVLGWSLIKDVRGSH